jgi:hypothetical protein
MTTKTAPANTDRIIARLHAHALRKEKIAKRQPPRFAEYADSLKKESEFLYKIIDCIEELQATITDIRKAELNEDKHRCNP